MCKNSDSKVLCKCCKTLIVANYAQLIRHHNTPKHIKHSQAFISSIAGKTSDAGQTSDTGQASDAGQNSETGQSSNAITETPQMAICNQDLNIDSQVINVKLEKSDVLHNLEVDGADVEKRLDRLDVCRQKNKKATDKSSTSPKVSRCNYSFKPVEQTLNHNICDDSVKPYEQILTLTVLG